jgi:hypothetical protein
MMDFSGRTYTDERGILVTQCEECGATMRLADVKDHVCQSEFVTSSGYCEDYPCCGHKAGECGDRAEFTSAYWHDVLQNLEDKGLDPYEIDMIMSGEDY